MLEATDMHAAFVRLPCRKQATAVSRSNCQPYGREERRALEPSAHNSKQQLFLFQPAWYDRLAQAVPRKLLPGVWIAFLLLLFPGPPAFSSVALLLEQPHGRFGSISPTGHVAVYLSRVCAATPVKLRRCGPGEYGVVISRYHHVTKHDWLAIPLIPYLYAVDSLSEVPDTVTPETVESLRDQWRREHLKKMIPDVQNGSAPRGNWIQLIGALYVRKIFAYELPTTPRQDDALIRKFNRQRNRSHFNLLFHNCADFSRSILNFYYPGSVRRSYSADLGITTPKQVAKSLVQYASRHEGLQMSRYILPQEPGTIARSGQVDGILEAILRKKYVLPIAIVQPYAAIAIGISYVTGGRFNPATKAEALDTSHVANALADDREPLWSLSRPSAGPSPVAGALQDGLGNWNFGLLRSFSADLAP